MCDEQSQAEPVTKDCHTCQRRRLKCDRSVPSCKKCAKRGLDCLGYGVRVRWVNGVASRGKLQGKAIPVRSAATTSSAISCPIPSNLLSPDSDTQHLLQLLPYFRDRVARRLAWVDGPENPWRQMVLPLAEHSQSVLSSILALTAQDLASQYPAHDQWNKRFQSISGIYYHRALGLLAQELGMIRTLSASSSPIESPFSPVLASAIILCNNGLLTAHTAGWRVHLQAARQVILAAADRLHIQRQTNRLDEFFLQEFYSTSVWEHLTSFSQIDGIIQQPLTSTKDAAFTDFVRIIHHITRVERLKSHASSSVDIPQCDPIDTIDIYTQLEMARENAIQLSHRIKFWSDTDRRDFEHLVWMYYHATLVYSYQALAEPHTVDLIIKHSCDEILSHLSSLSETGKQLFAQDSVWPLFVVGTESRDSREGQKLIERELTTVMAISRILDRHRVLSFLQEWWSPRNEGYVCWIDLARQQSLKYDFFIA